VVVLALVVGGGYAYYALNQRVLVNTAKNSLLNSPKPVVENAVVNPNSDTSNAQIDKDVQNVDNNLNTLDSTITQIDKGLNDQPDNLQ
jgi:hypothetical protein